MATSSSHEGLNASYFDHFTCNICFEVLREPVQCARNEHYFCKSCITQHLTRSQTCPVCQDPLTITTLRRISRVVANLLQQFHSPRCRYANRGCTASVRHEVLLSHHEECGFAPVRCSNDECEETVNRKDLASHEESCGFGQVTCEECKDRISQKEYGKHSCVFLKEVDKNKLALVEVQKILREMYEEQRRQGEEIQRLVGTVTKQNAATESQQGNDLKSETQKTRQSTTTQARPYASLAQNPSNQVQAGIDRQIVVAGGGNRSYEVFNWSTQKWIMHENALFYSRNNAFSFVYGNKIMICGGTDTNRIECLDMTNPLSSVSVFPSILPSKDCGKGALCRDKIMTFAESVSATNLKAPYKTEVHMVFSKKSDWNFSAYGAACVNGNGVVIVGGRCTEFIVFSELMNDVQLYNPTTKKWNKLAPLPYKLADMAVQAYKDNVIILGGETEYGVITNDVLMYNITSQQCSKLPSMLEKRSKCAAVIMGDKIVAFGGTSSNPKQALKTAEYLVLGEDKWKKLPPMHVERADSTACVAP